MTSETIRMIRKRLSIGAAVFVAVTAAGLAVLYWYNATHLLVTKTRPVSDKVAAAATDVVFWFNKPISADTAKNFSISPAVAGSTTVKGNALMFEPDAALADGGTYTAVVSHATSADGRFSMGASKLTFTIGFVPADQQPKEVQERGLKLTDNQPPQVVFFGDDALTDQGVSTDQLSNAEAVIKKLFDAQPKKTDYVINIDNVVAAPFDPNSDDPINRYTFTIEMNDTKYSAQLDCSILGDARLHIDDSAGKEINISDLPGTGS